MRLYHSTAPGDPLWSRLCSLACQTDLLDLCHVKTVPRSLGTNQTGDLFPMLWRFLPTLDPEVSVMMSRDLDSRFTEREAAAVMEWLESNKSLHAMRDHPWHGVSIMGGGWGAKLDTQHRRDTWKTTWDNMLSDSRLYSGSDKKGPDQDLLHKYVWKTWGYEDSLHHDSYTCSRFPGSTGWPTQRLNTTDHNYFGAVGWSAHTLRSEIFFFVVSLCIVIMSLLFLGAVYFMKVCPVNCRRRGHRDDWIYC